MTESKELQRIVKENEIDEFYEWKSKPLFVDKDQVKLVDPNDQ